MLGAAVAAAGLTGASASRADISVSTPINGPIHGGLVNYVSMDDCLKGKSFTFPLMGLPLSGSLEVWIANSASSSCFDASVRTPISGVPLCRKATLSKQTLGQVTIDVKEIVKQMNYLHDTTVTPTECSNAFSTGGQPIPLYIFFIDPTAGSSDGTTSTGTGITPSTPSSNPWVGYADLAGPPPPTDLTIKTGNGLLLLSYTGSANSDVVQYLAYCAQNTGQGTIGSGVAAAATTGSTASSAVTTGSSGMGGGGGMGGSGGIGGSGGSITTSTTTTTSAGATTTGSAGGADGGAADPSCVLPANLVPGEVPPDQKTLLPCEIEPYGTAAIAVGKTNRLTNGSSYVVAIAGIDKVGNIGPLSNPICGVPAETEDFFTAYREAGGQAGGGCGLCSMGEPRDFSTAALAGTALAAVAFGARRRRSVDRSRRGGR